MTFEMFEKEILEHLQKRIEKGEHVSIEHIRKNNNAVLSGLQIRTEQSTLVPVLYLEEYYRHYLICDDLDYVGDEILRDYRYACKTMPNELRADIMNFEYVRDRIIYRLVNYEKNKEILSECPFIKLHDLAVSFRWIAYTDQRGVGSAMITNKEMDLWQVTTEELIMAAQKNTPRLFPAKIILMDNVLREAGLTYEENDNLNMYICTNELNLNGASVILYQDFLRDFTRKKKSDFYVLPSSIHEMILVPANQYDDLATLGNIVKEANQTVVELGEILSESVYCYRWKEERLEKVM